MTEEQKSLGWLSSILDILLERCPWDSAQTTETLRYLTIEEVYELSEAITANKPDETRKELGDLFMHLLFYSKLAARRGDFDSVGVLDGICQKLIARHPHIALPDREGMMHGASTTATPGWEQVKMREGRRSTLEGVPVSLPPLVKAVRLQEKAAGMGFEFNSAHEARRKADEEFGEFVEALDDMHNNDASFHRDHAEEELGDLLFALVNWARMEGINADNALSRANLKFQKRYNYVEQQAISKGRGVSDLTLDEMVELWRQAKAME